MVKSELRLKHWTGLIAECQASDQTVKAWCKQHDISDKTYYYWLRKVRKQTMEQAGISAAKEEPVTFKPLKINPVSTGIRTAAIVHLPGATIEICEGASQQTVETVLLALKTIC